MKAERIIDALSKLIFIALIFILIIVIAFGLFMYVFSLALKDAQEPVIYDSVTGRLKSLVRNSYGIYLPDSAENVSGKSISSFRDPTFELDFSVTREEFDSLLEHKCWIAITRDYVKLSEEESWNGDVHEIYMNTKNIGAYLRCGCSDEGRVYCDLRDGQCMTDGWFTR